MNKPTRPLPKTAQNLLQSLLAAMFVLAAFLVVWRFYSVLAAASLAASAFIAFGFPAAESARPRYMIGGYACAVVLGGLCRFFCTLLPVQGGLVPVIMLCGLAVFLASFAMFSMKLQHPPAVALAVSMVTQENALAMGLVLMGCIVGLCGARALFARWINRRLP